MCSGEWVKLVCLSPVFISFLSRPPFPLFGFVKIDEAIVLNDLVGHACRLVGRVSVQVVQIREDIGLNPIGDLAFRHGPIMRAFLGRRSRKGEGWRLRTARPCREFGGDMRDSRHGREVEEPRSVGHVLGDKARAAGALPGTGRLLLLSGTGSGRAAWAPSRLFSLFGWRWAFPQTVVVLQLFVDLAGLHFLSDALRVLVLAHVSFGLFEIAGFATVALQGLALF